MEWKDGESMDCYNNNDLQKAEYVDHAKNVSKAVP